MFQSLTGRLQTLTFLSGIGYYSRFQSLTGRLQTPDGDHFLPVNFSFNPSQVGYKPATASCACSRLRGFQSLTGRLQTYTLLLAPDHLLLFQSLTGRLQPWLGDAVALAPYLRFQSLTGRLQTESGAHPPRLALSFQSLTGRLQTICCN